MTRPHGHASPIATIATAPRGSTPEDAPPRWPPTAILTRGPGQPPRPAPPAVQPRADALGELQFHIRNWNSPSALAGWFLLTDPSRRKKQMVTTVGGSGRDKRSRGRVGVYRGLVSGMYGPVPNATAAPGRPSRSGRARTSR